MMNESLIKASGCCYTNLRWRPKTTTRLCWHAGFLTTGRGRAVYRVNPHVRTMHPLLSVINSVQRAQREGKSGDTRVTCFLIYLLSVTKIRNATNPDHKSKWVGGIFLYRTDDVWKLEPWVWLTWSTLIRTISVFSHRSFKARTHKNVSAMISVTCL